MVLRKKWYEIVAPKMFKEKVVGETMALDPKNLMGRKIEVSLMNLTKDYSKFYVKMVFKVNKIENARAFTELAGYDTMREMVYRMVQRRMRRVDVIQDVTTADGKKIRIKTVFVLVRRVNTAIKNAARAKAKGMIEKTAKENKLEDLIKIVLKSDLQKKVRKECSKLYPVGNIDVRKIELL